MLNSGSKSLFLLLFLIGLHTSALSITLRVAQQSDALSMDPHSLNDGLQLGILGHVYEALIHRGKDFKLTPALATNWQQTSPTVWRFNLRKGVRFHNGTPFTADDVIFSYERTKADGSDLKAYVSSIKEIQKIDDYTIDIVTSAPFPILPESLVLWMIMSKKWCTENAVLTVADKQKGRENAATHLTNGTGPFKLRERQPNVRSVFDRNTLHWRSPEGNVDQVIFTPIPNDATRVASLLSGQIDLIDPLPIHDIERVKTSPGFKALQAPEKRVIFLGMDQLRDELLYSNVKDKNPFKDKRIRQAVYQAIDIDTLKNKVMLGAVNPTALLYSDLVRGYPRDLNKRLQYDVESAKNLMVQAGYPHGFDIKLNCASDRYVNETEVCKAIAKDLARIQIKVNLELEPKSVFAPKVYGRNTSFYLLGWSPPSNDALSIHYAIMSTPSTLGRGFYNLGGYSNSSIDALTSKIATELDERKRNAMIYEAAKIHQNDIGHIPLYQQALNWGVKNNVYPVVSPSNAIHWDWIHIK
jgi:peptide/nickel transport system substrate-binding protein